jgi:hypothetical protein
VQVVYVGDDADGREIDGVEEIAKPGQPVDVPVEIGGWPPSGHRADVDEDGNSTFDPGSGLLAQPGTWQLYVEPGDPLEAMTLPALKKYATEQGIDLGEAKHKSEVLGLVLRLADSEGAV